MTNVRVDGPRSGEAAPAMLTGLEDRSRCTSDVVGGKAANLATLMAAGFAVPSGFCLSTAAYRGAVAVDDLLEALEQVPDSDHLALSELATRVRQRIMTTEVPTETSAALARAYTELQAGQAGKGTGTVAVRSSATVEDLPDASFAGQYDTYLDVRGHDQVVDAVKQCWASLWSRRAVLYRAANGIGHRDAEIAVVVQVMVDAACAGALFTANPTTGHRDEMVLEAVAGLGEALVSGSVQPETYRLDVDGALVESSGPSTGSGAVGPSLTRRQLRDLWGTGLALQRYFGRAQDAEWAFDRADRLWLTQSRPITTLFPVPSAGFDDPRVFWSLNAYQGLNRPFTPIGAWMIRLRQSAFQPGLLASGIAASIPEVDGWLWWEVTDGARSPGGRARLAGLIDAFTAPAGRALLDHANELAPIGGLDPLTGVPPRRSTENHLHLVWGMVCPGWLRSHLLVRAERLTRRLDGPTHASAAERLDYVERIAPQVARLELDLPRDGGTARRAEQLATTLLREVANPAEIREVFAGVAHNPTTEMNLRLWRLAARIRRDPASREAYAQAEGAELAAQYAAGTLPAVAQDGVAAFLDGHGHRVGSEIDLGLPRWSDDPSPVMATLVTYVAATEPEQDAEAHFAAAARAARSKARELVGRTPWRRRHHGLLAGLMLHRSRALRGLRELGKHHLMSGFAQLRTQLIWVGHELVERGVVDQAEDVMFLLPPELRAGLDGRPLHGLVTTRRERYDRENRRRLHPSLVFSDGRAIEAQPAREQDEGKGVLRGLAGAAGVVAGVARIVHDPNAATVAPGEVLVCPSTDPGWTPLFLTAVALVSETGGMTSHGTTVAREYGIPAVVGVPEATTRIPDGALIVVDGATGTISIPAHQPGPPERPNGARRPTGETGRVDPAR